ncbi:MAG: lipopolysaccharide biosynthesis protein [Terriglobales bacterium]
MSSPANLDRSLAGAIAWNAVAKWSAQILSWVSAIVVARLLTPYDYGIVGMAGVYLLLANIASQAGIEGAIVAAPQVTGEQIAGLNTIAIAAGLLLLGVSCLVAPVIAGFFSSPPLRAVVMVASLMYVINALQIVPAALLAKALRFKLLAGINLARSLCQIVVTVLLAWLGYRYWSLVVGTLAAYATATLLTLVFQRYRFAWPRWQSVRHLVFYSGHMFVAQLSLYLYEAADVAVAGRMLGAVPLGDYTVAYQVGGMPVAKITNLVTVVASAFFSAVQDNLPELRRQFLNLSEIMALAVTPASFGIALTADYLVLVVFGPKYRGAIGALCLLGLLFSFRSMVTLLPKLLSATGDAKFVSRVSAATALVLVPAFVVGSRWGITGVAAAWLLVYPLLTVPLFWRLFRKIELRPSAYFSAIQPAVTGSLAMAAVLLLARWASPFPKYSVAGLAFLVLIGIAAYAGTLLIFQRQRVLRVVNAFRRLRQAAPERSRPVAAG